MMNAVQDQIRWDPILRIWINDLCKLLPSVIGPTAIEISYRCYEDSKKEHGIRVPWLIKYISNSSSYDMSLLLFSSSYKKHLGKWNFLSKTFIKSRISRRIMGKRNEIPQRWEKYSLCGGQIPETPLVAFKVPLSEFCLKHMHWEGTHSSKYIVGALKSFLNQELLSQYTTPCYPPLCPFLGV